MSIDTLDLKPCISCGNMGCGKYCSNCGQPYATKRITLPGLLHDVFHFFTHLEKGFGYTLKQLVVAPGTMQRNYIEGNRARYQKPFSMFIICASVNAVARYWIYEALLKYYHSGKESEASFFHEYMVLLYVLLMPLMAFITWLFFWKSKYNYAETGVLQLYNFSFIFIGAMLIAMLRFIWPTLDTAYIELPLFMTYNAVVFINFYNTANKWRVLIKSIVLLFGLFMIAQWFEDRVIGLINPH